MLDTVPTWGRQNRRKNLMLLVDRVGIEPTTRRKRTGSLRRQERPQGFGELEFGEGFVQAVHHP